MRRTRLIWFAAGAGTSALAAIGATALNAPADTGQWALRISEGRQSLHDGQTAAKWTGSEIARDCGAREFDAIPGVAADSTDATRVPLVVANNPALGCIVEQSRKADLGIGVHLEDKK